MFRCISLKELNSLTTIDTFSCLSGLEVTHQTAAREVPGSIPGSDKDIVFVFVAFSCYKRFYFFGANAMYCHKMLPFLFEGPPVLLKNHFERHQPWTRQLLHGFIPTRAHLGSTRGSTGWRCRLLDAHVRWWRSNNVPAGTSSIYDILLLLIV